MQHQWLYCSLVVALLVTIVAIITSHWGSQTSQQNHESNFTILTWKDGMTEMLATANEPIVLLETPFNDVISMISLNSLRDSPVLVTCKTSTDPVFQYHAVEQPLAEFTEQKKSYKEVVMTVRDVVRNIYHQWEGQHQDEGKSPSNTHYYSAGSVELLNITFESSFLNQLIFPNDLHPPQVNYWFGGGGVTAYNHYDTSHNLHHLIKGKKRFILTPPILHSRLKLHSCLHPLYRQTQVDPTLNSAPNSSVIIIDLLPHQTLYLPPYWFHTVVTVEPSVSLNIWSNSRDYLLMEDVLLSPIPFESSWSIQALLEAAKLYIDTIINDLFSIVPSQFINDIVLPRYDSILHHITPGIHSKSPFQSGCGQHLDISEDVIDSIQQGAEKTEEYFKQMSQESVKEINMANYIEHILYTLLRDQESLLLIPLYLKQCW